MVVNDRRQAILISGSCHEGSKRYLTMASVACVRRTSGHHSFPLVPAVYRGEVQRGKARNTCWWGITSDGVPQPGWQGEWASINQTPAFLFCPLSFLSQRLQLSGEQLSPAWKLWMLHIILSKCTKGEVNLVFTKDAKSLLGPCKAAMPVA